MSCIDAEVLQAMVDKDAMPVTATAEASELSRRGLAPRWQDLVSAPGRMFIIPRRSAANREAHFGFVTMRMLHHLAVAGGIAHKTRHAQVVEQFPEQPGRDHHYSAAN